MSGKFSIPGFFAFRTGSFGIPLLVDLCRNFKRRIVPANKAGKEESHGAALGEEEVALTRKQLGWNYPPFETCL
jgi:hypothetical protein